jgi:ABC-type transporter Mla subunit MlaD
VQTDGLVGNAFVQITPGSDGAPVVAPGGRIRGAAPVELSDVIAEASQTMVSFRAMIDEISPQVSGTLTRINGTVDGVNDVLDEVEVGVRDLRAGAVRSVGEANRILADTAGIVSDVRGGRGTLGKLLTDDALYADIRSVTSRTAASMEEVRGTTQQVRTAVERLFTPGGPTDALIGDVRAAADAAEELVSDLAETTEAFKRNWLVRGFFQQRGFFDIDALTPREYRTFAANEKERTVLRIWLAADVLFGPTADGNEQLTTEGRARLDSAMGTFLDYRRDGPLVVEGYATGGSTSAQLLQSDRRARIVRDYLVRSFRRDASITGALGLAADARGAPADTGRWDGVALALFIPK